MWCVVRWEASINDWYISAGAWDDGGWVAGGVGEDHTISVEIVINQP